MKRLDRIAIMVEIARRKREHPGRFGKTSMLKLVYFLQEVREIPLGYRFTLYTYGPYDPAVMRDIDYARATDLLQVEFDQTSGYQIEDAESPTTLTVSNEIRTAIEGLLNDFGRLGARALELRSTIVFVAHDNTSLIAERIASIVQELKPKYVASEISDAINELDNMKVLQLDTGG